MAEVDEAGLVKILDMPGNVAVMVRYQGLVSVFSASIPLGAKVENLPPAKNFIDELVFANLTQLGIPPSPLCDDATFLRRVSIDIAGHLPTVEETRAFLADNDPDKRDRLIESLLGQLRLRRLFRQQMGGAAQEQTGRGDRQDRELRLPLLAARQPAGQQALRPDRARAAGGHGRRRRESGGGLVQAGEGSGAAARRRGAAFSRRADALRPVPSSSVRALEPSAITTASRRSSARSAAGRPPPTART